MRHNETVNIWTHLLGFNVRRAHRANVSDGDVGRGLAAPPEHWVTGADVARGENSVRDAMETGD